MSKHTPGPWKENHETIEAGPRPICKILDRSGKVVDWPCLDKPTEEDEESEANARLIAAAADLHEAAVIALIVLGNMTLVPTIDDGGEGAEAFVKAHGLLLAALEKAEGRNK